MKYKNVCIFCGSAPGKEKIYEEKAVKLSKELAKRHLNLIYGAGNQGLMGIFAKTMIEQGSYVIGITPKHFEKINEKNPLKIDEYHVVKDMHKRKAMMYEKSDAFIVFPGGIGTVDEMAEVLTWRQLGLHNKPVVIYNVNQYFENFLIFLDQMRKKGFAKMSDYYCIAKTQDEIFDYLDNF